MFLVPIMAVKYTYICINMDFLAVFKKAKLGSRIVPNPEVLLCRFKAHNLSIARCEAGSMIAPAHKVLRGFRQYSN
jgi:hypothetical protein